MPASNIRPVLSNHVTSDSAEDAAAATTYEPSARGRSLDVITKQLTHVIQGFDVATVGKMVVVAVAALLIYDLLVYMLASTSSRKRLLVTPWLVQVLADAWDNLSDRGSLARSDDAVGPILKSLASAAAQYGSKWEKSRLL